MKNKPNTGCSLNDWAKLIHSAEASSVGVDEVPEGWETAASLGEAACLGKTAMKERLSKLASAGLIEMRRFRVMRSGRVQHIPHYKVLHKSITSGHKSIR